MARQVWATLGVLAVLGLAGNARGQATAGAEPPAEAAPAATPRVLLLPPSGLSPALPTPPANFPLPAPSPLTQVSPAPVKTDSGAAPASLTFQTPDLLKLEVENEEMRRQIDELNRKFNVLATEVQKRASAFEAEKAEREGRKRRPAGTVPSTERKVEPMYRVGLFWWRDNTKEIEGRGAYRPDMPPVEHEISEGVTFGDGLTWTSKDKYFKLTFHNLTQLDYRQPFPEGDPLHGGFVIPRQRWYFNGTVGDYVDFVTAINRGYGSLDVLDSYADFIVNREWLKFRVGRFKMPSQYEYIEIAEGDLLGPERSLFVANYAANRQLGVMAHGFLAERRFRYYVAVGSGPRRSFEDFNSSRDYFFYLDYRPFITDSCSPLQNLHLVSTFNFGEERNPLAPFAIQTMNQMSTSADAGLTSPTTLEFKNGVFENGPRMNWGFEPVYYYKSFGFLGSVQGGFQDYSAKNVNPTPDQQLAAQRFIDVNNPIRTHVPMFGWSFGAWYFLTGEEITRRRFLVEPRRPFGFYNGTLNPGAFEVFGRFANLQLGNAVFTGGLVDPTQWTNRVSTTDFGVNWYLNHFVKFTFDWQHVFPATPVVVDPLAGSRTKHIDMLLFRTQVFF